MGSSSPENAAAAHRQAAMTERIQSSRDLVTKARQKVTAARPAATAAGPQCERPYQNSSKRRAQNRLERQGHG